MHNRRALQEVMETALAHKPSTAWHALLVAAGIPCGPVYRYDQVFDDPQVQHRHMAVEVEHPKAGRMTITSSPLKLSKTPGTVRAPAPMLGQHTNDILRRLGYDETTIATYHAEGVV